MCEREMYGDDVSAAPMRAGGAGRCNASRRVHTELLLGVKAVEPAGVVHADRLPCERHGAVALLQVDILEAGGRCLRLVRLRAERACKCAEPERCRSEDGATAEAGAVERQARGCSHEAREEQELEHGDLARREGGHRSVWPARTRGARDSSTSPQIEQPPNERVPGAPHTGNKVAARRPTGETRAWFSLARGRTHSSPHSRRGRLSADVHESSIRRCI